MSLVDHILYSLIIDVNKWSCAQQTQPQTGGKKWSIHHTMILCVMHRDMYSFRIFIYYIIQRAIKPLNMEKFIVPSSAIITVYILSTCSSQTFECIIMANPTPSFSHCMTIFLIRHQLPCLNMYLYGSIILRQFLFFFPIAVDNVNILY